MSSWIVCDGDIDPEWIESLNSVLDDNRLLTMPSGERIQFGPNVNFLFETHDLSCASPATISRMGMIFLRSVSQWRQSFCGLFVPNSIFPNKLVSLFFFPPPFSPFVLLATRTSMWVLCWNRGWGVSQRSVAVIWKTGWETTSSEPWTGSWNR